MTRLFSDRKRPVSMGPYPTERLARTESAELAHVPPAAPVGFQRSTEPTSIVNAMGEFQAMLDALRVGRTAAARSNIPESPAQRADHLKAFGYFSDASIIGVCQIPPTARLREPIVNPQVERLATTLRLSQIKMLGSGSDQLLAELREATERPPTGLPGHRYAVVLLHEFGRDPSPDEPGTEWIRGAEVERAALRGAEVAVVLSEYLSILGWSARAHTGSAADVDLNQLAVAAGLATVERGRLTNPYVGDRFGLSAVTTDLDLACDRPLVPLDRQPRLRAKGLAWHLGKGFAKSARTRTPYARRRYVDGALRFEKLKRVDQPTTLIDEPRVARVPKRSDMFTRAEFGDMGPRNEDAAREGAYVFKAAPSAAQQTPLAAFVLLADGDEAPEAHPSTLDPGRNAANLKATSHWLGADAVGLSRCPDWVWYSHDSEGDEIVPPHDQAVTMIVDQGYETMEGASGDDWIAVSQSMRAYLRFALVGGVLAKHLRNLGHAARPHTVIDGDVIQPPLLLLAGLGEVSRIGEVILHPLLGPRLKSGVVTTTMPQAHDRPIDFGLQRFCGSCNKCARECPSGAISAGPKLMFNGYEAWKADSQKCTTYRITNEAGAMCGRCMKTCPWNLEGLFVESPFRWAAMNLPGSAKVLAALDDWVGNGRINPVKKWWWDLRLEDDGAYRPVPVELVSRRELQRDLDLRYEDQTLAVYPASLAPHPWPYPSPMDRELGIEAYRALVSPAEYRAHLAAGTVDAIAHTYRVEAAAPIVQVRIAEVERATERINRYVLEAADGADLPGWTAGAHLDVIVAPGFLRQFSLCGDPADPSRYEIAVLREAGGRGGSELVHQLFGEGRTLFVSEPINHFPLDESANRTWLFGGGIGITPMMAMAHRAHRLGLEFEFHYCIHTRADGAFLDRLEGVPWSGRVRVHVSDEGTRAELGTLIGPHTGGDHVYTCGPDRFMAAVLDAAAAAGYPDDARHLEYFSVPELPEYENHPFVLRLARSGRDVRVPADSAATEALQDAGLAVDVKCSDGICGVCKAGLVAGDVEHRDFVLSAAQRETSIILCQSRAADPDGVVTIDR